MPKLKRTRLTIRFLKTEMDLLRAAAERQMVPVNALVRHNVSSGLERWPLGALPKSTSTQKSAVFVNATIQLSDEEREKLITEAGRELISITALIRRKLFQPAPALRLGGAR